MLWIYMLDDVERVKGGTFCGSLQDDDYSPHDNKLCEWLKPVIDYQTGSTFDGYYMTDVGVIISTLRAYPEILSVFERDGYPSVDLYNGNGQKQGRYVHRLVAATWLNEPDGPVYHKDGDKRNNTVDNLTVDLPEDDDFHFTLTTDDVLDISEMLDDGYDMGFIANCHGVTQQTISYIGKGMLWGDVTGRTSDDARARRLSPTAVKHIRERIEAGDRLVDIANDYNTDPQKISRISQGKTFN